MLKDDCCKPGVLLVEKFIKLYGHVGEELDEDTRLCWLGIWQSAWQEAMSLANIVVETEPSTVQSQGISLDDMDRTRESKGNRA